MMGYDRAITMFSPDGRLLQVEYAKKTVRQGSTAIGMVCKEGVVLVTDKRIVDKLIVADAVEKIWQIDDHIAITAAGILSDARILVERAQLKAQENKVIYDSPIDVLTIVRDIANLKQMCTQSGGLRPFGVSLLIAGVDEEGIKLFETDPTGIYFQYKATAIGEGDVDVKNILSSEYSENMSVDEGITLAISALKRVITDGFDAERLDCVYVDSQRKYVKVSKEKISRILSNIDLKDSKDKDKDKDKDRKSKK
jgi:proteasome alpha subunit